MLLTSSQSNIDKTLDLDIRLPGFELYSRKNYRIRWN